MEQPTTIRFVPARFFESFIAVARELILRPVRFFEQLRPSGSVFGLYIFLLSCLFLSPLFFANLPGAGLDTGLPPFKLFAVLFISWSAAMVLGTLCLHALLISPLFNVRLPYEATLSVVAYACIVFLVSWVPLLGIIANIYGLFLMYLGFKAIHRLTPRAAGAAVFLTVLFVEVIRTIMMQLIAPGWVKALVQAFGNSSIPT